MASEQIPPFTWRDVEVSTPKPAEVPVDIVGAHAAAENVRIATLRGQLIGAYHMVRLDRECFAIRALAVRAAARGGGVGRWLLGHALGVAESRGGRHVRAPCAAAGFFRKAGFVADAHGLCFALTPE